MTKMIEVSRIDGGTNVRNERETSLIELANSINENGLLQPITVRKISNDRFEVINGHRRFAAIQQLGEPFIECNVLDVSDKERLILQVVENVQRKEMSAYELVAAFNEMTEKFNCNKKSIAKYFNKSEQWVYDNYLAVRLLEKEYENGEIPEEKKKLSAGVIKASVSRSRAGESKVYECEGFNVRHKGHSYIINFSQFEAETEFMNYINRKRKDRFHLD